MGTSHTGTEGRLHTHTRRKYLGDILMAGPPAGRHARIHGPSDDSGHPSHSTQYTVHSAQRTAMDATARHVLLVLATHFLQDLNWGQLGLGVGVTLARKRSASATAPHTEPGRHQEVTSLHAGWHHSPRVTHASDATGQPPTRPPTVQPSDDTQPRCLPSQEHARATSSSSRHKL